MVGFETRYLEAQRLKRQAKKSRPSCLNRNEPNKFAAAAVEQRELVRKRLEEGYELRFAREVGGRIRQPFSEFGLRSEENFVLKYFVSLVPRGGKARASDDKANLAVQTRSKLLTLDYPYVELNHEFMAALRVDCDGIFNSPETCEAALKEVVRDGSIPCLPHIIVGDLMDDGTFARPHFIWLLPYGSAVWRSDDERCRKGPVKLFDAVSRGLAAALLDLGADPAVPTMTGRMKCPTSPVWCTRTPNPDIWPTLAEYAEYVDTRVARAVLTRRAAAVQCGLGLTASNRVFEVLRTEGQRLLAEWHFGADARMRHSRGALADHLHSALDAFVEKAGLSAEGVGYITSKVSDYLVAHFDPAKLEGKAVNRGKLLDVVCGLETVKERQKAGGQYAGTMKGISTLNRLVDAFQRLQAAGETITQTAVAAASGISRRTAVGRWAEIVEAVERNKLGCENCCIDKKGWGNPAPPDTADIRNLQVTMAQPGLTGDSSTVRQVVEYKRKEHQASSKTDVLLREAANEVRWNRHQVGTRLHIGNVIERITRANPDQPRLDAAAVLAMVECPPPMDPDLVAILAMIEDMAQRQMAA
ncbi:hypothetical protein [Rhizobium sp. RAF56]|uniref:hypothetical protein n=1 Tax=Rhizobium sp. RAF56 TaxID=3233062 RepID=UPI003F9C26C3